MIKMIIADDDIWIREGIKNNIEWEQYNISIVKTVSNPIECLDLMEEVLPQIIIMDINMPKMSGLEFLEIINKAYPTVKVIIISGYREFEYAQQAVNLNAFAFISKPINYEGLLNVVLKAKSEIDENLLKIKEDEEVNIRVKQQIIILKNNYLVKLIKTKVLNEKEISKKNKIFNIDMIDKQYMLLKLDLKDEEDIYLKHTYYTALTLHIEKEFKGGYDLHSFYYETHLYILIVSKKINKNLVKERLKGIQDWTNYTMNKMIGIVIGNVHCKIQELHQSYQEIEMASDYEIIAGKNALIDFELLKTKAIKKNTSIEFSRYLLELKKTITLSIKNTNREDIDTCIEEIIIYMGEQLHQDISKMNCLYMTLAIFLYEILIQYIGESILIESSQIYNELLQADSLIQIKQIIRQYIFKAVEEIEKDKQYQNNYIINKAIHYIDLKYKEPIGLGDVAEHLNIHPNYLSKLFKQVVGKSFTEYINEVKMESAKQMLRSTNMKVYEIGELLSYNDTGYFIKIFKKIYGVSPNEYRKIII